MVSGCNCALEYPPLEFTPGFAAALLCMLQGAQQAAPFYTAWRAVTLLLHVATMPQVKETSLVQHAVEGLATRVGQQVTAVVCPWKWSMPWQGRQRQERQPQQDSS